VSADGYLVPGEVLPASGSLPLNPGAASVSVVVANSADRPIQVGSHVHFAAANKGLEFDREAAWGMRLDIPAGTAVRFEPGIHREVSLVPIGGSRFIAGLRRELAGPLDKPGPLEKSDIG
jgi:urease subunit beta